MASPERRRVGPLPLSGCGGQVSRDPAPLRNIHLGASRLRPPGDAVTNARPLRKGSPRPSAERAGRHGGLGRGLRGLQSLLAGGGGWGEKGWRPPEAENPRHGCSRLVGARGWARTGAGWLVPRPRRPRRTPAHAPARLRPRCRVGEGVWGAKFGVLLGKGRAGVVPGPRAGQAFSGSRTLGTRSRELRC